MKPHSQTDDAKMLSIQNTVIKASISIVKFIHKTGESIDSQTLEVWSNVLALLGQSNKLIKNKRNELHKKMTLNQSISQSHLIVV